LYKENDLDIEFTFLDKSNFDITDKSQINQIFNKQKFDYCINCAAYTNVDQAEKTKQGAHEINAEGVKNLALVCKAENVILIHISTDYVFDGEKSEPYTVDDIPNPINEYGISKLKGEQHVQDILKRYFIVRTSWLYSKKHGHNFYRTIINLAKTKAELSVTADQMSCPTNTVSLTKYLIDLINVVSLDYGIHHFSNKSAMTWYDFAKLILTENNLNNNTKLVRVNNFTTLAKRPKYSVL
jgi:dTDP-4-dehydrorhamnose reductase